MRDDQINDWLERIINGKLGFNAYEKNELIVFPDRDLGIAEFVVKALGNPNCKGSKELCRVLYARHDVVE